MNKITKRSTSNIALVKYWGKKSNQIPMNPSISMTLENSHTKTSIIWQNKKDSNKNVKSFRFNNQENKTFEQRIEKFIDGIKSYIPLLNDISLEINSSNNFPHSSGIASSASAMSALALCLVQLENEINGAVDGFHNSLQKASFLARLGSGSASRSVYRGFTLWGKTKSISESSDEYAIPINEKVHASFKQYHDAILIVSNKKKTVSSAAGHNLMNGHVFAESKFNTARINTEHMLQILKSGELSDFAQLVEYEALMLHAMMLSSNPPYILLEPNTLQLIQLIQQYRQETHIPVCFTLDAGANVHLLYPSNESAKVKTWIKNQLLTYCINNKWIDDNILLYEDDEV